jgi:hypothetical protein
MNDTLCPGVILERPEPFTYRVRLSDGRDVQAQPSRLHFGNRLDDVEQLQALGPGSAVMVRVTAGGPSTGWLVRAARTEDEWRSSSDPALLLETVRGPAAVRKQRLFACACCRGVWDLLPEGPHRGLLAVIEAYADGRVGAAELEAAMAAGDEEEQLVSRHAEDAEEDPLRGLPLGATAKAVWATRIAARLVPSEVVFEIALDAARSCVEAITLAARARAPEVAPGSDAPPGEAVAGTPAAEAAATLSFQAEAVREIFGNPFQPVGADPSWRTARVVTLAGTIEADGDFDRLSELAAALEAAGCTANDLLEHCRTPRRHVRGCWALDLVLGQR